MNFLKKYFLHRELQELEYKLERHYTLSQLKVELENKQGNVLSKLWNQYQVMPEYELLSEQLPMIEARILEIKGQLRTT